MPADRTFHIRPVLSNQPLGVAMQRLLPQQDKAAVKRLIHERHVHVNGNLALDADKRLKTGDVVKVLSTRGWHRRRGRTCGCGTWTSTWS